MSGSKSHGHEGEESTEKQQHKTEKERGEAGGSELLGVLEGAGTGAHVDEGQPSSEGVCVREHVSVRAGGG